MPASFDVSEIRAVADAMADAARSVTLAHFRAADLTSDNKDGDGGFDPVTAADRGAEQAMRAVLAKRRPHDAILGEEFGAQAGTSGLRWVLDPVDGTRAFICGAPTWGVLISLEDDTGPVFGLIDQPYIGERFIGSAGAGELITAAGRRPLRTRGTTDLAAATLMTTFPEVGTVAERTAFERVRDVARLTRYGFDCYGYALLALGQVDLVVEAGLSAYDVSAPIAVVQAAGGIATDWNGRPAHGGGQLIAAATEELHAAALERLAG